MSVLCPRCGATKIYKSGFSHDGQRQRYACRECRRSFLTDYVAPVYQPGKADEVKTLYRLGTRIDGISEYTDVPRRTITKWTREISRPKTSPPCPRCASNETQQNGTENKGKIQRYRCKACGKTYQDNYIYDKGYGQSE